MNIESKYLYLDQLIGCYFNQDYDMEGETIEEILNAYLVVDNPDLFSGLVIDIDNFLKQDNQIIEQQFIERYQYDFYPELWDTTAKAFLTDVREQVSAHLKQHYS